MQIATGVCPVCGTSFEYRVTKGQPQVYCSREHAWKASAQRQNERYGQMEERRCARCKTVKPRSDFAGTSTVYCKPCMAEYERDRRKKHGGIDPQYTRIVNLRRYGLTPAQFDARLASQGNRCAICRTNTPGGVGWHVDHDHACCNTRKRSCGFCTRGILCTRCNIGIGNFKDDPVIIQAALDYIQAHRSKLF